MLLLSCHGNKQAGGGGDGDGDGGGDDGGGDGDLFALVCWTDLGRGGYGVVPGLQSGQQLTHVVWRRSQRADVLENSQDVSLWGQHPTLVQCLEGLWVNK